MKLVCLPQIACTLATLALVRAAPSLHRETLNGSVLYVAQTKPMPNFAIGLVELTLRNLTERVIVNDLGGPQMSEFGLQTAIVSGSMVRTGTEYVTSLARSTPVDPWEPSTDCGKCAAGSRCCKDGKGGGAACYGVATCDEMHGGVRASGYTLGVDLAGQKGQPGVVAWSLNTSLCWAIAADPHHAGSLLCVEQKACANSSSTPCGNNALQRIDVQSSRVQTIGKFEAGRVAAVFAATFDVQRRVFYAALNKYLGDTKLVGMDIDTGEITSSATFPSTTLIHSLAYDESVQAAFGVVEIRGNASLGTGRTEPQWIPDVAHTSGRWLASSPRPSDASSWQKRFGQIDLASLHVTPVGHAGTLDKYVQFNAGTAANGMHFLTAFRADQTFWLLAIDVASGELKVEHERVSASGLRPTLVDMAYWDYGP